MANFWKLKLMYADYTRLMSAKGNKIVFQFYYAKDDAPNLYAYGMKGNNIDYESPIPLTYDIEGDMQSDYVLGNQIVTSADVKKLVADSNPNTPGHVFDYLSFTPQKNNTDLHIFYVISVVPCTASLTTITITTKPSPPYS